MISFLTHKDFIFEYKKIEFAHCKLSICDIVNDCMEDLIKAVHNLEKLEPEWGLYRAGLAYGRVEGLLMALHEIDYNFI
jgi:hypothetical protein